MRTGRASYIESRFYAMLVGLKVALQFQMQGGDQLRNSAICSVRSAAYLDLIREGSQASLVPCGQLNRAKFNSHTNLTAPSPSFHCGGLNIGNLRHWQ